MALTIKNDRVERLVRELADLSRESLTDAVGHAGEDRMARMSGRRVAQGQAEESLAVGRRCAALPDLDRRPPEEILGYGEDGLPDGH